MSLEYIIGFNKDRLVSCVECIPKVSMGFKSKYCGSDVRDYWKWLLLLLECLSIDSNMVILIRIFFVRKDNPYETARNTNCLKYYFSCWNNIREALESRGVNQQFSVFFFIATCILYAGFFKTFRLLTKDLVNSFTNRTFVTTEVVSRYYGN